MQIGGRDSPDQLAEWRFRIDRIAWIDVALPRSRLRKHIEVNKLRSLAVPREIGTHLARRHIGKCLGAGRSSSYRPGDAYRSAFQEASARNY
jgi:hypothetical protein